MAPGPRCFGVNLSPIGMSISGQSLNSDAITQNEVRETLRLFQAVCLKLLQEEVKSKEGGKTNRRVYKKALMILKKKGKCVNTGEKKYWDLSQELKLVMSFTIG
jgi:euchromatic histone-lysine N-methyltransferase